MQTEKLKYILSQVSTKEISVDNAFNQLKNFAVEDIEYAHIDHHRSLRKGFPEVIFGEGKTDQQIIGIMKAMITQENVILVTRVNLKKAEAISKEFPTAFYHEDARMLILEKKPLTISGKGMILILSAGTSDIPVAREALLTAKHMGNNVQAVFDVGIAGIHRLFEHNQLISQARVLIVVAGMEGALPGVVAGLVKRPVIAVPTSIGYGVSFGGITALFAMLNCCASNVAVVNIDNGFGAGYMASMINNL